MRDGHEAAGRQRCDQPVDDAVRVVRVRVVVQEVPDGDQQQAHRFGEVDEGAQLRVGQDPLGVTQVGLRDPGRHPFVGEQGTGMHDDLRVVVDVDDPGRWVDRLGDLVGVLPGRQSGADVDDLGNALHLNDLGHRAGQERPVVPGALRGLRRAGGDPGGQVAVHSEGVLAAVRATKPRGVDAPRARTCQVDADRRSPVMLVRLTLRHAAPLERLGLAPRTSRRHIA
jgi:hypothetical protein